VEKSAGAGRKKGERERSVLAAISISQLPTQPPSSFPPPVAQLRGRKKGAAGGREGGRREAMPGSGRQRGSARERSWRWHRPFLRPGGRRGSWLHRCAIGSYNLGKLGWADQLLGCAGRSILTFPFFSFLSFLFFYFLQPNSPMYQFIYCKLLHTRGIWRRLASHFKRLKGRKGVERHTSPCCLKNYGCKLAPIKVAPQMLDFMWYEIMLRVCTDNFADVGKS
jgi:hypothetical protein